MNYYTWNKILVNHFFKPENSQKQITLYLSKDDVINIGKQTIREKKDSEIWEDFIQCLKYGDADNGNRLHLSPIKQPLILSYKWDKISNPPFLAYLLIYILPLTESESKAFNSTNYYGRVNEFFKKYELLNRYTERKISTPNFKKVSKLWNLLEDWTISNNFELGIFELKQFGNPNWIYVGKPFSQCILSPKAIKSLPEFYYISGLLPHVSYPDREIKACLISYGEKILGLTSNVISLIQKSDTDELGHSITEIIKREYNKWNGELKNELITTRNSDKKGDYILAPLFLQLKINEINEAVEFSYRMKSINNYPEDLKLDNYEIKYAINGWSQTIKISFTEEFEIYDEYYKWLAKFPKKDIRIFSNAGEHQLSIDYWIESDRLVKNKWMYLLCTSENLEIIKLWGNTFKRNEFIECEYEGVPPNFHLFKIFNPKESLLDFPILTLHSQKSINLMGGLQIGFKSYLSKFPPNVELENGDGDEKIYIENKKFIKNSLLKKIEESNNKWQIPESVDFIGENIIFVENENNLAYKFWIKQADYKSIILSKLPFTTKFEFPANGHDEVIKGNNIYCSPVNYNDITSFKPIRKENNILQNKFSVSNSEYHNLLIEWICTKKVFNHQEFYTIFETIFSRQFTEIPDDISIFRSSSLKTYNYIGVICSDYENNQFYALPPKLILLPTSSNRKALLIGARSNDLVRSLIDYTERKRDISINIFNQGKINQTYLLPDIITFKSINEDEILKMSKRFEIEFNPDELLSIKLREFSPDIEDYMNYVFENNLDETQNDFEWARKKFCLSQLEFVKGDLNKEFELVEYSLRFTKKYGIWFNGKYYIVDKNWGRYVAINHNSPKTYGYDRNKEYCRPSLIFYNENDSTLAIPAKLPLPKLLSKSIYLLSGEAPVYQILSVAQVTRGYNVFNNIPSTYAQNLFKFKLNMVIETI